jgi:glucoamylase
MKGTGKAIGAAAVFLAAGVALSGGTRADSVGQRYLPGANALRTVVEVGERRRVIDSSLGEPLALRAGRDQLGNARPLGSGAPPWARRMQRRSLLVLLALTDRRSGAALAGAREGWEYVWPRDAAGVALAFAAAGYPAEAEGVARFLLGLDLGAAARFHADGSPVAGRAAQGDAAGWAAIAAQAAKLRPRPRPRPWRDLADYQEKEPGEYLANAVASTATAWGRGSSRARRRSALAIRQAFRTRTGVLTREAGAAEAGVDSAAAWAVRPFTLPALFPLVRRSLLRLAAHSGRFGVLPSEDWDGGEDPWTAATAWTAWSLAALGEGRAALRLIAALRRASTPLGMLPERVDAETGVPTSTTPLAWSHAFALLALYELWP